ncbi:hypothetical protein [Belliella buryatensis]
MKDIQMRQVACISLRNKEKEKALFARNVSPENTTGLPYGFRKDASKLSQ